MESANGARIGYPDIATPRSPHSLVVLPAERLHQLAVDGLGEREVGDRSGAIPACYVASTLIDMCAPRSSRQAISGDVTAARSRVSGCRGTTRQSLVLGFPALRQRPRHLPPPQRLSGESGFSLSDQCPPPGCCSAGQRMRSHSRCKSPCPPPRCCSACSGLDSLAGARPARRSTASRWSEPASSRDVGSSQLDPPPPREATSLFERSASLMSGAGPSVPRPLFPS